MVPVVKKILNWRPNRTEILRHIGIANADDGTGFELNDSELSAIFT